MGSCLFNIFSGRLSFVDSLVYFINRLHQKTCLLPQITAVLSALEICGFILGFSFQHKHILKLCEIFS